MTALHTNLCCVDDFIHFIPGKPDRAQIIRQSNDGSFPPSVKTSFKAERRFSRKAVVLWFCEKFFAIDPELCADVERYLLAPAKKKARRDARSAN
jgi:hypothetical protein